MIVRFPSPLSNVVLSETRRTGELLEKVTRVLTPEEKLQLEKEWVGRDGSKRKLEV